MPNLETQILTILSDLPNADIQELLTALREASPTAEVIQVNQGQAKGYKVSVQGGIAYIGDQLNVDTVTLEAALNKLIAERQQHQVIVTPNNLPRSGAVAFVGRETELINLYTQMHQLQRPAVMAICGAGGTGKTNLVLQYALHHLGMSTYLGGICWLQAKEYDIGTEIINFAVDALKLSVPADIDLPQQTQFCWHNWPIEGNVLVIIDDVSGADGIAAYNAIKPYLPPQDSRFWVLLTTRLRLDASIQSFQIDVLSKTASLELLRSLIGSDRLNQDLDTATALCEWLGYLPLGLELVGHFLACKPTWSLAKMQQRLNEKSLEAKALIQSRDITATYEGVAAAFELSWQDLKPEAKALAYCLSLYALAPIAWEWIEDWYKGTDLNDLEDWRDEGLANRSLVNDVGANGNTMQLHQIIREFFRSKLEQWPEAVALKQRYCQAMVQVAQQVPQTPTREQISAVTATMPHLVEAATTWQQWLEDDSLSWPFTGIGRFYEGQGAYGQAEPWYQDCLTVTRDRLGDAHPDVATSMNNLAYLYQMQGRYGEAESLYREALTLSQRLLGDDHPDVATSMNNLAYLYQMQGRYGEAEPLYCEALTLSQRLLGDDHPAVATSMNNLAGLYESQGRYEEAEPLYREALMLSQRLLGDNHPDVAQSMNNLAGLYRSQGRYGEAEPLYREALMLRQRLLGDAHPDVATSMNNLAGLYESQGRYEEAELLYREALTLRQRLLGDAHPDVAQSMNNLAGLYRSQGRYEGAEPLYREALTLRQRLLGDDHPDVAQSMNNLAGLYRSQGRYGEAEPLYREALTLSQRLLGDDHPDVATSMNNLAYLYQMQGRYEEAEPLYREALTLSQRLLGDDHPAVATSMNNLAGLYQSQGRYSEAEPLAIQALQLSAAALGQDHPTVGILLGNLAWLRVSQGIFADVEAMFLQALSIVVNVVGPDHPYTTETINRLGNFVTTVQAAGQAPILSDHPLTQALLRQLQEQ